jgi:ABC-type uncharacterized transport system ATPase subunit
MANLAELRRRKNELDAALASGARSITLDGVTITLDLEALSRERQRIESQLPETRDRRPRAYRFRLNG